MLPRNIYETFNNFGLHPAGERNWNPEELPSLLCICPMCEGHGSYRQSYNLGCGQGMARMMGDCDYCLTLGIVYRDHSYSRPHLPGASVIAQILHAREVSNDHV